MKRAAFSRGLMDAAFERRSWENVAMKIFTFPRHCSRQRLFFSSHWIKHIPLMFREKQSNNFQHSLINVATRLSIVILLFIKRQCNVLRIKKKLYNRIKIFISLYSRKARCAFWRHNNSCLPKSIIIFKRYYEAHKFRGMRRPLADPLIIPYD